MSSWSFPFVYNDGHQDRMKGVLILASQMAWPSFQQQLSVRLGLPVGSYQVMLACSRASDPDQVQKIPVHEGTNFNVLLSRHNPSTDMHAHFLVQPRQVAKERSTPVPMRKAEVEGHDDEGRSRGSSACSSPRYSSAVLSHLAASMAASNRHAMQSPVGARGMPRFAGGSAQQYGAGHQQQPVHGFGAPQQQQQHGRASHLGATQDGSRMLAASPGYLPTPHAPHGYAGPQRSVPVPTDGYGVVWTHQGAPSQAAVAQQARTQQAAASRAHIQAFQLQQQRQLAALAAASAAASAAADATGGPAPPPTERSDLPSAQSSRLSSPEGSAFPHVANGGIALQPAGCARSGADVPTFKHWLAAHAAQSAHSSITSSVSVAPPAPATPPAADAPPRVVLVDGGGDGSLPIPIMAPPPGAIPEAEFWRNSLQDPVVSGFNGASPFGAIGKSPT